MTSVRSISASSLILAAATAVAAPAFAGDEAPLADAAHAVVGEVIEAAGAETVAQSRAILIAPLATDAAEDHALLSVQLVEGRWSNPLLLRVENNAEEDTVEDGGHWDLDDANLVVLAMTETGLTALTDDDPALGGQYDLAVIHLSSGQTTVPRLSGFDLIAFTDSRDATAAVREDDVQFLIDPMRNASLYGDYFMVDDILGRPNQFALFGGMIETLRTSD
ncbi:MAG: hypothetical protein AAF414_16690 [Pseudomonadota bacterium]